MKIVAQAVPFTVDVHLLAELGERLVGKPAIALGELVKNAYDADAGLTRISFEQDEIIVVDDGHGMSLDELKTGFLRVGTALKEIARYSPGLKRRMTGSKGVGRLATQMLGRSLTLETRSSRKPNELLRLRINWDDKVEGDDLTKFTALLDRPETATFLGNATGTAVRIAKLTRDWTPKNIEELAQDVWMLRSPFKEMNGDAAAFTIEFQAAEQSFEEAFERVMTAWIDLYEARLTGELHESHGRAKGHGPEVADQPHVHLTLQFADQKTKTRVVLPAESSALGNATFEVRIYKLQGHQPLGLKVRDVRDYLNAMGGVYLYDEGFRLPYYGPDTDWLGIEMDHAHRKTVSKVLPKDLQVKGGLTFLPTTSRLFGAVHVSTGAERDRVNAGDVKATDSLQIQVSRDRMLDTSAFDTLKSAVRAGLDLYAHEKARVRLLEAEAKLKEQEQRRGEIADPLEVLDSVAHELTDDSFDLLTAAIVIERETFATRIEINEGRAASMAALATAGMVALLIEHEQTRLLPKLMSFVDRFETSDDPELKDLAYEISTYVDQLNAVSPMLRSIMDPENRKRARLGARKIVHRSRETIETLLRGITVEIDVGPSMKLPPGSLAEWSALFQNVLMNAANAVMVAELPRIKVVGRGGRSIRVLDNGYGIDLDQAESFFEPFTRGPQELPVERRALGMGGTGLGLTIVRSIAEAAGAEVGFEKPPQGWSTAFKMSW